MKQVVELLQKQNRTISTMESCTGGGVASAITNISGASEVIKFSAVTYSNEYKIKMGVSKEIIDKFTVYSIETANEMSKNISLFANSDYGVGITGQINQADSKNKTSENDKIYISIYDKKLNEFYTNTIIAIHASREENKKMIIKVIERMLLEIL